MSNAEIARQLGVTPAAVSQTFKRLSEKVKGVNDTLQLMREIGMIEQAQPIELTSKGFSESEKVTKTKISFQKEKHSTRSEPTQKLSKDNLHSVIPYSIHDSEFLGSHNHLAAVVSSREIFWIRLNKKLTNIQLTSFEVSPVEPQELQVSAR